MSDDAILVLTNVESAYGPIRAIRGVSLRVRPGEIATVLGSNGAGKSTILKTISGGQCVCRSSVDSAFPRRCAAAWPGLYSPTL